MKIKIEQITILIVLILIVIAALIMIGYRRVLKIEERVEGLEKVLLVVKKGFDFEHTDHQSNTIDSSILNHGNLHQHMPTNNMPEGFPNFMEQNNIFVQEMQNNNQNDNTQEDNISIQSMSASESESESESDDEIDSNIEENTEENVNEDLNNNQELQSNEDEIISELSDQDESDNEENNEVEDNQMNNGLSMLMKEDNNFGSRNTFPEINTLTREQLNNYKRPELFQICANNNIKTNKREDRKNDLISRIEDFQKKNVSI